MGWEVMNKSAEINKRRVRLILPIPPERKKGEIFFFEKSPNTRCVVHSCRVGTYKGPHDFKSIHNKTRLCGSLCSDGVVRKISEKLGQICVRLSIAENKLTCAW